MSTPLTDVIPKRARAGVYAAYVLAAFILGGIQVAYAAGDGSAPGWLDVANAVLVYVGAAVAGLAVSNVTPSTP